MMRHPQNAVVNNGGRLKGDAIPITSNCRRKSSM